LITLSVILPESRQLAGDDAMYPVGQNVLIVDDDLGRGQAIERILREEGFAVTIATEGFAALRAAGSEQFALVIAAVELPGTLDGVTTVRRLRARQPWLKALFTGEFARGPRWAGRDCDEFIAAPFHRRELLGCVFELLQRESLPGADLVRRSRLELDPPAPRPI
jgi:DNA-binding response OmpR family regulator